MSGTEPANPLAKTADAVKLVDRLRGQRRFKAAERLYHKIIQHGAPSARAHFGLAMVLYRTGRPEDAIRAFEDAVALSPQNAHFAGQLGNAHLDQCAVDAAKQVFEDAIGRGAGSAAIYFALSAI